MGFIQAFKGALSGTFADQWVDFLKPQSGISATAGVYPAIPQAQNNGRGENYKGNENIISNGSKIVVPEGTALITIQDGAITGFIAEPGGYIYKSDDPNSLTFFGGDNIFATAWKSTWDKVKAGGKPNTEQLAFYVTLKPILGVKFGTRSVIQWNDSFFETKVGAYARGTFDIQIIDPLLFVRNYLPTKYILANAPIFDFNDLDDEAVGKIKDEFVNSLSAGITSISMDAKELGIDTYDYISKERDKFAEAMGEAVESSRQWKTNRGLDISNVTITIEYDDATKELLAEFQRDDKEIRKARRMGEVYGNNMAGMMAAASGQAMQAAAANENGAMMGFMGMNMAQQGGANLMGAVNNMQASQPAPAPTPAAPAQDSTTKLLEMKKLLDAGAITQEDYDKVKNQILGL